MGTNVQGAYNQWADQYDSMENKTRDLDKIAAQTRLTGNYPSILEFGCGTGKNTEWLASKAEKLTAVDFSELMINKAKEKVKNANVLFLTADITKAWPFEENSFDLLTCNLILEHVENLDFIFSEAARVLKTSGCFFVSELHPFKQYQGGKARFKQEDELIVLDCYMHHTSDFFESATKNNFVCIDLKEWFDDNDRTQIPRLISFLFCK